ncbi:unnamed protein product, partial [marine sediment metagenome]
MEIGQPFSAHKIFIGSFIPNALMKCKDLSANAKLAWARLSQYSGVKDVCWPKQVTLAEEIGISERYIQKVIQELEDKKFIKRIRPTGQDRLMHKSNRYHLLWHEVFEAKPRQEQIDCSVDEHMGVSDTEQ